MHTIIISEKSPVLFGYFVLVNALARKHACTISWKNQCSRDFGKFMLRLHYVPGGHGSHDFGHRGRNGVTVTQRRGTGSTNVARRGCRDRRDRFLNSQKICHGSHGGIDLLKCAVVERGERNKT